MSFVVITVQSRKLSVYIIYLVLLYNVIHSDFVIYKSPRWRRLRRYTRYGESGNIVFKQIHTTIFSVCWYKK